MQRRSELAVGVAVSSAPVLHAGVTVLQGPMRPVVEVNVVPFWQASHGVAALRSVSAVPDGQRNSGEHGPDDSLGA